MTDLNNAMIQHYISTFYYESVFCNIYIDGNYNYNIFSVWKK